MQKALTRVAIIGGGTGLSTLLRGLKKCPIDLTAIVTVADDGGSSGRIRDDFQIPPPGDIRQVIAALSEVEPLVEEMFQYRFQGKEELGGHSLGNLMLTALTAITGDFSHAIAEMSRVLNVHGKVLPAANQRITLMAELENGTIVKGESKIPSYNQRIQRVFLSPADVLPVQEAVSAIESADIIIIGPGSLYTSILPNLLVNGIREAVLNAKGHKIYICNLMTQAGETSHYSAGDHVQALIDHVGANFLHTILINKEELPLSIREAYSKELAEPVRFDVSRLEGMGLEVIKKDIASIHDGVVRHDANNVAAWIVEYATNYQQKKQSSAN